MTLGVGSVLELRVDSLGAGGDGVGRADGLVVFTPLTAPGDRARVRLLRRGRRHAHAELLDVLEPGAARRTPPCPWFGRCGGCSWLHLEESEQRAARRGILLAALRRIGGVSEPALGDELESPRPLGYRARARVAYEPGAVGFRAAGSHEVVDVERCAVLDAATQSALAALRAAPPRGRGEAEIRGFGGEVEVGARALRVGPRAFLQANRALWGRWHAHVLEACGGGRLAVELYAGVGFYTAGLDERFQRVVAVERGPAARDARRNARAEVVRAPAEAWAPAGLVQLAPELVLVNPPRSGCHRNVLDGIEAAKPARVVYVSCDPATLARDVKVLRHVYRVTSVALIDALPQTHHVEAVCTLELT